MSQDEANALAFFINGNSARYQAGVLDFGKGCWVVVRDTDPRPPPETARYIDPIVDLDEYLTRERRATVLDAEYHELLLAWRRPAVEVAAGCELAGRA